MSLTAQQQKRCRKICNHFGVLNQIVKLIEELGELLDELTCGNNVDINLDSIAGEMADVEILLYQVQTGGVGIMEKRVQEQIEYKLTRTEQRIQEGYYAS